MTDNTPTPPKRTRVKICGFTNAEQALFAARMGIDALGLVFHPPSPRAINSTQAQAIVRCLPPFITIVALFVNETAERITQIVKQTGADMIQFHGDESPEFCRSFERPFIKAIRVQADTDIIAESKRYSGARGLLLDAWHPDSHGGTGSRFNWNQIPKQCELPLILAGGLTPDNIQQALQTSQLDTVDISSGVESTKKGQKSPEKIATFLQQIRQFDQTQPLDLHAST